MEITQLLLLNGTALGLVFGLLWLVSLLRKDVSIVDIFWGLGFVVVAWLSLAATGLFSPRNLALASLVSIWGVRLAAYLTYRNWGKPEDYRYASMRESHGRYFPVVSLFTVFGLQALLALIISLPLQVGMTVSESWQPLVFVGAGVWFVGFLFESVGDFQLARFKADPDNRGKVMNRGLWRYTRHPNYFGDFLVWWGFYLMAAEAETWWWTIVGPLLMSFLLIRVSGVFLLERSLKDRVAGYREYVQRTSAFFPLPPKSSGQSG